MRIGFFTDTYTPQINGVVTSIRLFKSALERRGHEVHVFAPSPEHADDCETTVRFPSVPFVFQPEMRFASPLSVTALRRMETLDFDVIHSHDPFTVGLVGLSLARRKSIPYIHTYHTLYPEYVHYVWETRLTKRLAEVLSRDFCDACDWIIAPSTKVSSHLRDWGVERPIEILPTGVDTAHFSVIDSSGSAALRERLELNTDDLVAIFVGRLGKEKNVQLLIRAMAHVKDPRIKLLIVGDGPHRATLEALVDELHVRDRVRFAGYLQRPEVAQAYRAADVLAFASTSETQGLVVGEAMAAGLPVVAVADAAVADFVVDGLSGALVVPEASAYAQALEDVLKDTSGLRRMADSARKRAEEFSIDRQAERLEALYVRAIETYTPRTFLPETLRTGMLRVRGTLPSMYSRVRASSHLLRKTPLLRNRKRRGDT